MAKTAAELKQAERDRKRARGLKRVEIWLTPKAEKNLKKWLLTVDNDDRS